MQQKLITRLRMTNPETRSRICRFTASVVFLIVVNFLCAPFFGVHFETDDSLLPQIHLTLLIVLESAWVIYAVGHLSSPRQTDVRIRYRFSLRGMPF